MIRESNVSANELMKALILCSQIRTKLNNKKKQMSRKKRFSQFNSELMNIKDPSST